MVQGVLPYPNIPRILPCDVASASGVNSLLGKNVGNKPA